VSGEISNLQQWGASHWISASLTSQQPGFLLYIIPYMPYLYDMHDCDEFNFRLSFVSILHEDCTYRGSYIQSSSRHIPVFRHRKGMLYSDYFNRYPVRTKSLAFATSIEPGQPVLLCRLTKLYIVGWSTYILYLDGHIPITDIGLFQNWSWISPLRNLSR
jgi:hypothetical protein